MDRKQKIAVGALAAVALFQISLMQLTHWMHESSASGLADQQPPQVVEKSITTLNIKAVETICYHDLKHWLVGYGSDGWFIVPRPSWHSEATDSTLMFGDNCDGSENPIPSNKSEATEAKKP